MCRLGVEGGEEGEKVGGAGCECECIALRRAFFVARDATPDAGPRTSR